MKLSQQYIFIERAFTILWGGEVSIDDKPTDPNNSQYEFTDTVLKAANDFCKGLTIGDLMHLDDNLRWNSLSRVPGYLEFVHVISCYDDLGLPMEIFPETEPCPLCGMQKRKDQSCICFDNHCQ